MFVCRPPAAGLSLDNAHGRNGCSGAASMQTSQFWQEIANFLPFSHSRSGHVKVLPLDIRQPLTNHPDRPSLLEVRVMHQII